MLSVIVGIRTTSGGRHHASSKLFW